PGHCKRSENYLGSWWRRGASDECKRTNRKTAAYKIIKETKIMTPKDSKKTYWQDIAASCEETGLNRLFVAAQAALDTSRGQSVIGRNLFGITATKKWRGAVKYVRTFEYFDDDKQGHRFPKVHSITRMPDGRYKYVVDRAFRDYTSVRECLTDHSRILLTERYAPAMPYKDDVYQFAYRVAACGYCTAKPADYAGLILKISKTLEKA